MRDPRTCVRVEQFIVIRFAVIFVWHMFPLVWLLSALDYLSPFTEHIGYVLSDLCAKYLLLFVYVSQT